MLLNFGLGSLCVGDARFQKRVSYSHGIISTDVTVRFVVPVWCVTPEKEIILFHIRTNLEFGYKYLNSHPDRHYSLFMRGTEILISRSTKTIRLE